MWPADLSWLFRAGFLSPLFPSGLVPCVPSPRNGQIFRKAQYPNTEPRRNKIITINEIESVILKLLPNKIPGSDGITSEFYQTFRKER